MSQTVSLFLLTGATGGSAAATMMAERRRQRTQAVEQAASDLRAAAAQPRKVSRWLRSAWSQDGRLLRTAEERRLEAQYGRFQDATRHGPTLDQAAFASTAKAQKNVKARRAAKARRRRRKWKHQRGAPQNVAKRSQAKKKKGQERLEVHEVEVAIHKKNVAFVKENPVASPRSICSYDSVAQRMVAAEQRRIAALAADIARRDREASKSDFQRLLESCAVSHGVVLAANGDDENALNAGPHAKFAGSALAVARLLRGRRGAHLRGDDTSDGTPRSTGGESACSWRSNQVPYDGARTPLSGINSARAPLQTPATAVQRQQRRRRVPASAAKAGSDRRRPASAPARRAQKEPTSTGNAPPMPNWRRKKRDELAARSRARRKQREQDNAAPRHGLPPRAPVQSYTGGRGETSAPAAVLRRQERARRMRERRERAWRESGASFMISDGAIKRLHVGVPMQPEEGEEKEEDSADDGRDGQDSVPGYAYDSDLRDGDRQRGHGW